MYDCQRCGACCAHKWSWPVLKRDRSDAARIPSHLQHASLPVMRTCLGRCLALEGEVGERTSCSIYRDRPSACRAFVPGSPLCLEARAARGLLAEHACEESCDVTPEPARAKFLETSLFDETSEHLTLWAEHLAAEHEQ